MARRKNLSRTLLSGANLTDTSLAQTILHKANLRSATHDAARLREAILIKADLRDTRLKRASLKGVIYNRQTLSPSGFQQSYALKKSGANLIGANLSEFHILGFVEKADVRQAVYGRFTKWPEYFATEAAKAVLVGE